MNSSEEVGWMPTVLVKVLYVAPILTAAAQPCVISPAD